MAFSRHALLIPFKAGGLPSLLQELAMTSKAGSLDVVHAATIERDQFGELTITVAGDGMLGALIGHRTGATALVGPLMMIAVAATGSRDSSGVEPEEYPEGQMRALVDVLPEDASALLVVVEGATLADTGVIGGDLTSRRFVEFDVSPQLEPWLASRVDLDMRLELAMTVAS